MRYKPKTWIGYFIMFLLYPLVPAGISALAVVLLAHATLQGGIILFLLTALLLSLEIHAQIIRGLASFAFRLERKMKKMKKEGDE